MLHQRCRLQLGELCTSAEIVLHTAHASFSWVLVELGTSLFFPNRSLYPCCWYVFFPRDVYTFDKSVYALRGFVIEGSVLPKWEVNRIVIITWPALLNAWRAVGSMPCRLQTFQTDYFNYISTTRRNTSLHVRVELGRWRLAVPFLLCFSSTFVFLSFYWWAQYDLFVLNPKVDHLFGLALTFFDLLFQSQLLKRFGTFFADSLYQLLQYTHTRKWCSVITLFLLHIRGSSWPCTLVLCKQSSI